MNVVWKPLPGSQSLALTSPCNHTLYHGTRGPGKTDAQLMAFRKHVGQGYGQFWRGIIFDRQYKSLDDLIAKSRKWFPKFGDGAKFLSSQSALKWVWPTGEELLFRHMEKETDYDLYHGHEYPFIGWNELTKYPTSACYDMMMSTNRSSFIPEEHTPKDKHGNYITQDGNPLPKIPLMVFSTTNPFGAGHNWVKRRFINKGPRGKVFKVKTNVFNPQTGKREDVITTQVHVFGSYRENRYLDPQYVAELENISDPNRRAAWLDGNWDITAGGAFDDLWRTGTHILPRFEVPKGWKVFRSFDWGSSHPFSVGWWAVSNGEEVQIGGKKRVITPKSVIRISEIYGADKFNGELYGHNRGVKWSARKIAKSIKEHEQALVMLGWVPSTPQPGPADGQIYAVNEEESGSIASIMEQEGITWFAADKKPGSRVNGFQMFRDQLESATTGEGAAIYTMDNCEAFIETVPGLPRDEKKLDDVDTEAEDHVYDETRYASSFARPDYVSDISIQLAS